MLRWRLLLGTLLIGLLALLCWLDSRAAIPGIWLFPLVLVVTLAATGEMLWMLGDWPARPVPWVVYVGNAAIVCSNWLWAELPANPIVWPMATLALAILLAF